MVANLIRTAPWITNAAASSLSGIFTGLWTTGGGELDDLSSPNILELKVLRRDGDFDRRPLFFTSPSPLFPSSLNTLELRLRNNEGDFEVLRGPSSPSFSSSRPNNFVLILFISEGDLPKDGDFPNDGDLLWRAGLGEAELLSSLGCCARSGISFDKISSSGSTARSSSSCPTGSLFASTDASTPSTLSKPFAACSPTAFCSM
mmetsp:Transcript_2403/g.3684  ORF Transcript_2403/g.3684 Transcript_2403/m.3684 type:complete len:203 (+) Transcript_2403:1347-1955(+)